MTAVLNVQIAADPSTTAAVVISIIIFMKYGAFCGKAVGVYESKSVCSTWFCPRCLSSGLLFAIICRM